MGAEHTIKIENINRAIKLLVQSEWRAHRARLCSMMCEQRQHLQSQIAIQAQPILDSVVAIATRAQPTIATQAQPERTLDTKLLLEDSIPEKVDFGDFEPRLDEDLACYPHSQSRLSLCFVGVVDVPVT